jgi:hypothetical protein
MWISRKKLCCQISLSSMPRLRGDRWWWFLYEANQAATPVASLPSQLKTRRFLFELDTVLDHGHAGSI